MPSIATTLRYRNFPNNKPSPTPRGHSSIATFEKEPERDPEADCFMCRQANVYIKPIGMQQELRVGNNRPPPLTREEIDELSRKKHLTKKEVRKLLQCYFPEIKDIKYFQLHRYHSCCYDPKHVKLCKNHITALQIERDQHGGHHHGRSDDNDKHGEHHNEDENEDGQHNRVSFVRIKIEPTKGIPTRFLGPAGLPGPLADMLIKQVNRFEKKKRLQSSNTNKTSQPYSVRKAIHTYGFNGLESEDYDDDDDNDDNNNDAGNDNDDDEGNNDDNRLSSKSSKQKVTTKKNSAEDKESKLKHWELLALEQSKSKQEVCNCRHHVTHVEDNHLIHDWCRCKDHRHKDLRERRQSTGLAQPSPREVRLAVNEVAYDWCKCKHHRNPKSSERHKSLTLPSLSNRETDTHHDGHNQDWCQCKEHQSKASGRKRKSTTPIHSRDGTKQTVPSASKHVEPVQATSQRVESVQATPLSHPSPVPTQSKKREEPRYTMFVSSQRDESTQATLPSPAQSRQKRREKPKHTVQSPSYREEAVQTDRPTHSHLRPKRHTRPATIDETEPLSTELAIAYDPSAVDYNIIQEAIYYRTSSGRLIKPEITNSFTYDNGLPATTGRHSQLYSNREEVLYTPQNGQLQIIEDDGRRRTTNHGRSTPSKAVILSHPGSVYKGQGYFDTEHSSPNHGNSNTIPVLKLPSLQTPSKQHHHNNDHNEYQPAEFTLAKFSNHSTDSSATQRSQAVHSTGGKKPNLMSMQTSSKPTFINTEPTPNFGRQSSVVANRRWFDQPLGDQNLRPVHDSEYGVIAATSSDTHQNKSQTANHSNVSEKKENKCTIS